MRGAPPVRADIHGRDLKTVLETLCHDVRFGYRMLRRNPGFSALAIACLTLRWRP